jgi:hypothetical protein
LDILGRASEPIGPARDGLFTDHALVNSHDSRSRVGYREAVLATGLMSAAEGDQ